MNSLRPTFLGALVASAAITVSAQTTTWTGAADDDDWHNAVNWDQGVPTASTLAVLSDIGYLTLQGSVAARGIDWSHANFTLATGAQLTLGDDGLSTNSEGYVSLSGTGTQLTSAGDVDLSSLRVADGARLTIESSLFLTPSYLPSVRVLNGGVVHAAGGLFIEEANATITVTGANSLLQADDELTIMSPNEVITVADGGRIQVGADAEGALDLSRNLGHTLNIGTGGAAGVLGVSAIWASGYTLNFNHNETDYHFSNDGTAAGTPIQLSDWAYKSVNLNFNGSADSMTTLAGDNSQIGTTTLNSGTLRLGHSHALGLASYADLVYNGGTLAYVGGIDVGNAITLNTAGTFRVDSGSATQSGVIGGALGFTKTGAGELVLAGANTITGPTTVSAGTLSFDGGRLDNRSAELIVGDTAAATALNTRNGAYVSVDRLILAQAAGNTTTASWATAVDAHELEIGYAGQASVTVADGGNVEAESIRLGATAGSQGNLTISGPSAYVMSSDPIIVGDAGSGHLTLLNNTSVSLSNLVLARSAGSSGTVTLSGAGAAVDFGGGNYNALGSGSLGQATLQLRDGATLKAQDLTLSTANTTLDVADTGSQVALTGTLNLSKSVVLNISDGASVLTGKNYVFGGATLNITGPGSLLRSSNTATQLYRATAGTTTINITDGGVLDDNSGSTTMVENNVHDGAVSRITVSGVGSAWYANILTSRTVTSAGDSAITVAAGGKLAASGATFGGNTQVTVTGAGSTMEVGGTTTLAFSGLQGVISLGTGATLTAADGARVSATSQIRAGSTSAATVNFGAGGAAPVFDVPEITSAVPDGLGLLNLNHTSTSAALAADLTGTLEVRHIGSGGTHLTGNLTTTGSTVVSAGKLFIDGTSASATTVQSGGSLGGIGTINALTVIESGGTLFGGDPAGSLSFGNLTLNSGTIIALELGSASSALTFVGTLTGPTGLGGIDLRFTAGDGFGVGTYNLIEGISASGNTGTFADFDLGDLNLVSGITGYDFDFGFSGNALQVTVGLSAVPEPSTYAAILGSLALAASVLVRRHRGFERT